MSFPREGASEGGMLGSYGGTLDTGVPMTEPGDEQVGGERWRFGKPEVAEVDRLITLMSK